MVPDLSTVTVLLYVVMVVRLGSPYLPKGELGNLDVFDPVPSPFVRSEDTKSLLSS